MVMLLQKCLDQGRKSYVFDTPALTFLILIDMKIPVKIRIFKTLSEDILATIRPNLVKLFLFEFYGFIEFK